MFTFHRLFQASAAAVLGFTGVANAALVVTLNDNFGSDPIQVKMTFTQNGNNVDLSAQVVPDATYPNTGDLRGVFFNLANNSLINNLQASGTWFTEIQFNTSDLGNGANVNPEGPFEVGIEIGTSGIGANDIQLASFSLSSGNPLTLADFSLLASDYAARATSVGLPGSDRSGSSKVLGFHVCLDNDCDPDPCDGPNPPPDCDPDPCDGPNPPQDCDGGPGTDPNGVPEPITASLGLLSAAGLFLATHRRRNA